MLQTGAAWRFLPDEYPSPSTCWRRLKRWEEEGIWLKAWRTLLGALDAKGLLKWDEAFLDGSFAPAKKGANTVEGMLAETLKSEPDIVCLSALPPYAISHARNLYRRMRTQNAELKIIVGLRTYTEDLAVNDHEKT